MLGIERDNTLAGGAGSGVDPDAVLQIRTQQAVGIRVAQVGLAEERQLSISRIFSRGAVSISGW